MPKRRPSPEISLSFLDVICCGFGAVILLLMITKTVQPQILEESAVVAEGRVAKLTEQLFKIRGETQILNRSLDAKREQLSNIEDRIAILQNKADAYTKRYQQLEESNARTESVVQGLLGELFLARQALSDVEKRLLGLQAKRRNEFIAGIPVDSEYIIFVIDSSGSMREAAGRIATEIQGALDAYPTVKGIQVLNGNGIYLFSSKQGQWLEDTPAIRNLILERLPGWDPVDYSIPTRGIDAALRTFYDGKKKISVYVYGDDFRATTPVGAVIRAVDRINRDKRPTERLVRIHGIGFPTDISFNPVGFANLLRELAYRNGGTFVGLNDINP
jgi:hypothetical protein